MSVLEIDGERWLDIGAAVALIREVRSLPTGPAIGALLAAGSSPDVRSVRREPADDRDIPGAAKYYAEFYVMWKPVLPRAWAGATVDRGTGCLTTSEGLEIPRVMVAEADLQHFLRCAPDNPRAAPKRDVHRLDYRRADASLVDEMQIMIADRKARNPTDAGRAFVHKAAGAGTEASKVERLARRYRNLLKAGEIRGNAL